MTEPSPDTLTLLDRAIASQALPDQVAETAKKLRQRLAFPLRVTIMGLPDSGKTSVLELLLGSAILPNNLPHPVVRLVSGTANQTVFTLADGTTEVLDGLLADDPVGRDAVMVELHADLPALRRITIMEVKLTMARAEQAKACAWAASRSDLMLWCTRDFGAPEQAAWMAMPDAIKDQAILLRTKIDLAPNVQMAMDRVERLGRDEFDRVLPLNTIAALTARSGDEIDRDAFKSSGGQALIAAVKKSMDRTRQAFVDQADLLLARHPEALELQTSDEPVTDVAASAPPDTDATPPSMQTEDVRIAFETAVARLKKTGTDLISGDAPPSHSDVLARSVDDLTWLDEHLETIDAQDDRLAHARDDVQEAVDMVQLLQMERDHSAAADAVALMLQIRRRLQQSLGTV